MTMSVEKYNQEPARYVAFLQDVGRFFFENHPDYPGLPEEVQAFLIDLFAREVSKRKLGVDIDAHLPISKLKLVRYGAKYVTELERMGAALNDPNSLQQMELTLRESRQRAHMKWYGTPDELPAVVGSQ
jgi:hypothetical protein